jgi:hypothetical protein
MHNVDATKTSMCRSRKLDLPRSTEGLFSFGTVEGTYDGLFLGQRCTSHIISCRGRLSSNIFKSCFASKNPVEFLFHVNANMSLRCKLKKKRRSLSCRSRLPLHTSLPEFKHPIPQHLPQTHIPAHKPSQLRLYHGHRGVAVLNAHRDPTSRTDARAWTLRRSRPPLVSASPR